MLQGLPDERAWVALQRPLTEKESIIDGRVTAERVPLTQTITLRGTNRLVAKICRRRRVGLSAQSDATGVFVGCDLPLA